MMRLVDLLFGPRGHQKGRIDVASCCCDVAVDGSSYRNGSAVQGKLLHAAGGSE